MSDGVLGCPETTAEGQQTPLGGEHNTPQAERDITGPAVQLTSNIGDVYVSVTSVHREKR